jgi:ATP-binding cassette subfamily B protein
VYLENIIIIFLSAKLVIDGQITLGMMMAISSIVGTLNAPVLQLIDFIREAQDAKDHLDNFLSSVADTSLEITSTESVLAHIRELEVDGAKLDESMLKLIQELLEAA